MMRRTENQDSAMQVLEHLSLNRLLADGYKNKYERMYRVLIKKGKLDIKGKFVFFLLGILATIWLILLIYILRVITSVR